MAKMGWKVVSKKVEPKQVEYWQLVLMPSQVVFGDFDTKAEAQEAQYQQGYEPESFIIHPVYEGEEGYTEYF